MLVFIKNKVGDLPSKMAVVLILLSENAKYLLLLSQNSQRQLLTLLLFVCGNLRFATRRHYNYDRKICKDTLQAFGDVCWLDHFSSRF